jgi:arylsulfatase B
LCTPHPPPPLHPPIDLIARFAGKTGGNVGRQTIAAMVTYLDEAVGNVTSAIKAAGLGDNTIIVFVSDNGGPTHGDEGTWSNNFPLR